MTDFSNHSVHLNIAPHYNPTASLHSDLPPSNLQPMDWTKYPSYTFFFLIIHFTQMYVTAWLKLSDFTSITIVTLNASLFLTQNCLMAWVFYKAFYHFWTLTAPGHHSFQMYEKKQREHPDKLILLAVHGSNYTGLDWHEGEQIMTELFIAFIHLPALSE